MGGTLINVYLRVYFDVFQQSSRCNMRHKNRVRSMFLEFLLIVEGGRTPDKRISEGLILTYFEKVCVVLFEDP